MNPDEASSAFAVLEAEIRDVFRRHDPSGLFGMGAPADEHDSDVHRVISALQRVADPCGVSEVLQSVWREWIAARGQDPIRVCDAMAPEVWSAWRAFRRRAG